MSININFEATFLEALTKSYAADSYVRTLGFATPGDGGGAMYVVTGTTASAITDKAVTYGEHIVYCDEGRFHIGFDSENSTRSIFEIVPQNGRIFVDQFGVLSGDTSLASANTAAFNNAVGYASSNGLKLELSCKGTYFFSKYNHPTDSEKTEGGIALKNNMFLDGNGAILEVYGTDAEFVFFHTLLPVPYIAYNVTLRNFICKGRRTNNGGIGDQFLYANLDDFVMQNVTVKNFGYGLRTRTRKVLADYEQPEIINKNWLIENCVINVVMGLQLSEIDGIIIKNTVNTSLYPDADEALLYPAGRGTHNIYMSSNCLNVRLNNVFMGNVTGDAVHKAYAVQGDSAIRLDNSHNHFYTDISIHKANSPLTIGLISQNVMCDNVLGTYLRFCVNLSTADNFIIANSSLSATREEIDRVDSKGNPYKDNPNYCICVEDSSKCWMQNTYLYYNGIHRKALDVFNDASAIPRAYNRTLSVNKKHRRNYIGPNFDINNYMLKFTGCEMESTYGATNYYFEPLMRGVEKDWLKTTVTEYWDNCKLLINTGENLFRPKCINNLATGITFRNSYFYNEGSPRALFRFQCAQNHCYCDCYWGGIGKRFPGIRIENSVFDHAGYEKSADWNYLISVYKPDIPSATFSLKDAINISGSYVANSHRITNGVCYKMNNLMAI